MHQIMELLSASGEAVIMLLILMVLFVIGRGRLLPSEKTLFIERPGRYSMKLAPGLNLAQPFIEAIAKQLAQASEVRHQGLELLFEVRDKELATRQRPAYHLAIMAHDGMLHFEASHAPQHGSVLAAPKARAQADEVEDAVTAAARSWGIGLLRLDRGSPAT